MILNQKLTLDGDNVHLRNTIDVGSAISLAHDRTQEGGERSKNIYCLGHIPPEMWLFDPWLIEARKAQLAGDRQSYADLIRRFFDVHTSLKVINKQKYFNGWCFS